jgi:hypothetical protein
MSREVDKSDLGSLSEDDIRYLQDRGQLTPTEEEEFGVVESTKYGAGLTEPPELGDNLGDAGTADDSPIVGGVGAKAEPIPVIQPDLSASAGGGEGDGDDPSAYSDVPYEEWPKKVLQQEIEIRNAAGSDLRKTGTVAELSAALREDDEG